MYNKEFDEHIVSQSNSATKSKRTKTPDLSFSRLVDGNLEEIEENDWKRIRTLMRYLLYDKEPLRAVRYGRDGVEIL